MQYHIAEINIARMKGVDMNDPVMREFKDNLDTINALAESSEGFIWRLKDDTNNATSINPYNDVQVIINISVWQSIEALENFTFKTHHTSFLKRRKDWFNTYGKAYFAMWWLPVGVYPVVEEAVAKLDYLQCNGASEVAFNFKQKFPVPDN